MENTDKIVEMCRLAVADIIASVGGVGNLLQDDGKMKLVRAISNRLTLLGADVDAILGAQLAGEYHRGMVDADALLYQNGKDVSIIGMNKQVHLAGVESIVADAMQDMNASFRTAIALGIANIDTIMEEVNADIAKGMILGNGSNVVARRVEQSFLKNGMTSFITKDGKQLPLDFYAQTVVRTKMRVAHTTGAVNRYQDAGVNHIKIDEHHPTCQKCARYQGMVIALKAEGSQGFPVANEDVPLPPFHPNCQHTARPFVMEGHSKTDIANEKKKWNNFDPDQDTRTDAQRNLYKNEQDIRKKARQEMKDYEIMKSHMGDKAPKTLSAYRRMKRKNDDSWKALQADYKRNIDDVDAGGSAPGTPKRKAGSSVGASSGKKPEPKKPDPPKRRQALTTAPPVASLTTKTPKAKATPKPKAPPKPKVAVKKPPLQPVKLPDPPTPKPAKQTKTVGGNITLDKKDINAHKEFDKIIDGTNLTDRRKLVKKMLSRIPGGSAMKIRFAKIQANGHVLMSKDAYGDFRITEFALRSVDYRPERYQYKTLFHEFFHARTHGLNGPPGRVTKEWTQYEEVATECSAFFMGKRAGMDMSDITPSYGDHLINTLPLLKQMDEFKDCVTMEDFGAKFMKYRFDDVTATADWEPLTDRMRAEKVGRYFDRDAYFKKNYSDHIKKNMDRYVDMLFDSLQQEKIPHEKHIKASLRTGLMNGISSGKVNQEIRMIMPVAMNEVGVKIP